MLIPIWLLITVLWLFSGLLLSALMPYFVTKNKLQEVVGRSLEQCSLSLNFEDTAQENISWTVEITYTVPYGKKEETPTEENTDLWRNTLILMGFNPEEEEKFNIMSLREYMKKTYNFTNIFLEVH